MAIILDHLSSKFRKLSAVQTQNALNALGISNERFIIGDRSSSLYEAGMFSNDNHINHYWLRRSDRDIEYFTQTQSVDFSPLAIPFFFQDFGISKSVALDQLIQLKEIRKKINLRYPTITFDVTDTLSDQPSEGYFIQPTMDVINVFYAERGTVRLLGWTTLPWIAGLAVAWFENYKRIPWSDFLPAT